MSEAIDFTWPTTLNRPECTTLIPADPRVPSLPRGECLTSRRDGQLWIDHADPRVVIGVQLLDLMVCGECPEVTVALDKLQPSPGSWAGAVVRIEAVNQTLVYRLVEYLGWYCGYIAEWPD